MTESKLIKVRLLVDMSISSACDIVLGAVVDAQRAQFDERSVIVECRCGRSCAFAAGEYEIVSPDAKER